MRPTVPSDDDFDKMVAAALDSLPQKYTSRMDNVAIVYADWPTSEQAQRLNLQPGQMLLGLYEGVPLPVRGGQTKLLPDKITLFKYPLAITNPDPKALQAQVRKTLWHEMAHYFGLDHKRIKELE